MSQLLNILKEIQVAPRKQPTPEEFFNLVNGLLIKNHPKWEKISNLIRSYKYGIYADPLIKDLIFDRWVERIDKSTLIKLYYGVLDIIKEK